MNRNFLDFESPIEELYQKIKALYVMICDDNKKYINKKINYLESKYYILIKKIFSKLDPWKIVQIARHPLRPQTSDYIYNIFTDFQELHGDRYYSSAPAIIGGLAKLGNDSVMLIGHQKGKHTKEKIYRNFGMARPEEYRKALRLMKLAEKFELPVFTFIDTPGAYPGVVAERYNQSRAIAENLLGMSNLKTRIICTIIGEAGSGGALAIGIGDRILMLEYSIYSIISPEGCASILWKDVNKSNEAACAMGITSKDIFKLKLIDRIIKEPLGGAHRCTYEMFLYLKSVFLKELKILKSFSLDEILKNRYRKFIRMGVKN
ncbi:acetyl-CoA carboxylase carboxyl transferase subunit alpha [Candidatus Legionella polyplacis]|uniref:Acetyl-coenzyme A carboxylase carboxyl transferase subunit alpha n=1 Tax=Candidatus Legionella polyplacis TaxID=2005262 RepID=A0ABZ2GXK6_9GAMM|nr:acetyl-CoA carboxylase carboxyltransferase subunit alpha [Candidatus Legionella polyplacis]ATW02014.1 acetyl-CoA carboxylase carboxyl transferase subunit alpha [Candidatus Legionella polyplacis]